MFAVEERDEVRERLLALAEADECVVAFLLPGWLEVDIAFTPAAEFGPLGPELAHRLRPDRRARAGRPAAP